MAFNVRLFYEYSKKSNSTVLPTQQQSSVAVTESCVLKDRSTILNPVLQFNFGSSMQSAVHGYNYAYIPQWKRYYYITNWLYDHGLWVAYLSVDVLASWKSRILENGAYILRSDSNYDPDIVDTTYPAKYHTSTVTEPNFVANTVVSPFSATSSTGSYVLGIIAPNSITGVKYYALQTNSMAKLMNAMLNDISVYNISTSEITQDLQKALVNPFQYIVSIVWIPYSYTNNAPQHTVNVGFWSFTDNTMNAYIIDVLTDYLTFTGSVSIPRHPLVNSYGNYLNLAPYAHYTFGMYPFGMFNLDSNDLAGFSTVDYHIHVDMATGKGILTLSTLGTANPILRTEAQVGVPIPTANIRVDYANYKTGLIAGGLEVLGNYGQDLKDSWDQFKSNARALFSGNTEDIQPIFDNTASAQVADNIASASQASMTKAQIIGYQGTMSGYYTDATIVNRIFLSAQFLYPANLDQPHKGRPLCQIKQLSTLSGFCLCANADISIMGATASELTAIKQFMLSGFYIE